MTDDDDGRHRSKKRKGAPPFRKGRSGNPKGRPARDGLIDEFFEGMFNPRAPQPVERRWMLLDRLFTSAMNSQRKDHAKLLELCAAFYFGKPRERVEMSGPGGKPIATEDATPTARRRTTGELRKRMDELIARAVASRAATSGEAAATKRPDTEPTPEPTTPPEDEPSDE